MCKDKVSLKYIATLTCLNVMVNSSSFGTLHHCNLTPFSTDAWSKEASRPVSMIAGAESVVVLNVLTSLTSSSASQGGHAQKARTSDLSATGIPLLSVTAAPLLGSVPSQKYLTEAPAPVSAPKLGAPQGVFSILKPASVIVPEAQKKSMESV